MDGLIFADTVVTIDELDGIYQAAARWDTFLITLKEQISGYRKKLTHLCEIGDDKSIDYYNGRLDALERLAYVLDVDLSQK